jgi:uncharacterized cupredoxin-like copper-binding protein
MLLFRRGLFLVLLAIIMTAVACQAAAPKELPQATFVGTEYAFEGPESLAGGWTQVTLDNQGELAHDLILVRLLEGKTAEDMMAMLASEEAAPPAWIDVRGGTSAGPGESKTFVSELVPGDYVMFSFGSAEGAPPDAAQGMISPLTVTEPAAEVDESLLPEATGTLSLVDFQFVVDGLKSGEQTVRISNDGTELHEALVWKLSEGATMEDFMGFLQSQEPPSGPPPAEMVSSLFLSPGNATYATMNLDPGKYVLVCFLPSEKNDMTPHFALGMVQEVTVE